MVGKVAIVKNEEGATAEVHVLEDLGQNMQGKQVYRVCLSLTEIDGTYHPPEYAFLVTEDEIDRVVCSSFPEPADRQAQ